MGLLSLAAPLRAQTLGFALSANAATNGGRQNFGSSLGLLFSLNAPLTITSLGYWDDDAYGSQAGVSSPLTVAIFDRNAAGGPAIFSDGSNSAQIVFSGTMGSLVGATVPNELNSDVSGSSSGRTGQFRVATLAAPIVLPAGNYALVAWGYSESNQFLNGSGDGPVLTANSFGGIMTFDGNAYSNSAAGSYPTVNDSGNGVSGPLYTSATFMAIPEPAEVSFAMAAAALAGAFLARRRGRFAKKLG